MLSRHAMTITDNLYDHAVYTSGCKCPRVDRIEPVYIENNRMLRLCHLVPGLQSSKVKMAPPNHYTLHFAHLSARRSDVLLFFTSNAYLVYVILLDGIVKHRVEIVKQIDYLQSTHNVRKCPTHTIQYPIEILELTNCTNDNW